MINEGTFKNVDEGDSITLSASIDNNRLLCRSLEKEFWLFR